MHIISGLPYSKLITVTLPSGRPFWVNEVDVEVLMQIRIAENSESTLLLDCTQFLTVTHNPPDEFIIDFSMSGSDTRSLITAGYYDMVMSDATGVDETSVVILSGYVDHASVVTAAEKSN
jgi:hypothetical protein